MVWSTEQSFRFLQWATQLADGLDQIVDPGFLNIYTGEGFWRLYSNPIVIRSFERLAQRGVKSRVIAGPVLSVYEAPDGERYSGLIELAEKDLIELYRREQRGNYYHYSVGKKQNGYWIRVEKPHRPAASLNERGKIEIAEDKTNQWAESLLKHFEEHLHNSVRCKNPRTDFLLMTDDELVATRDLAIEKRLRFDDLTRETLSELLRIYRQQKSEVEREINQDLVKSGILHAART